MRQSEPKNRFPVILQDFFCQYLINQRNVSPQTVASYRDTFRLFLCYARNKFGKKPTSFTMPDLTPELILSFLRNLEEKRGNCVRTRNARLAAIRSFAKYAALCEPSSVAYASRIMAIPMKRSDRPLVGFLAREEIDAIMRAPDTGTWAGRRDRGMLAVMYNTGARVSEITGLKAADADLSSSPGIVMLHGKGRKERRIPLWKDTTAMLRQWLASNDYRDSNPVFPNKCGRRMTRSGVEFRLKEAARKASVVCGSLAGRSICPHLIRHTTAMHLLQSGVAPTVIALWLGHESVETTHVYIEADLSMKEDALRKTKEPAMEQVRFRPDDALLSFLESL